MNLKKTYKLIEKEWGNLGLELKEETKDKIRFSASIVAKKHFDDGVFFEGTIYNSGTVHVFFTFDKLDLTLENLKLINDFNDATSFLKAYISKKNSGNLYLELHGTSINCDDERRAADAVDFFLNNLLSESVLEVLHPLTLRTMA